MLVLSCFPHSDERGGVGPLYDTVPRVMWETPTSHVAESLLTGGSGLHTGVSDTRTDGDLVIIFTVQFCTQREQLCTYSTLIWFFVCLSLSHLPCAKGVHLPQFSACWRHDPCAVTRLDDDATYRSRHSSHASTNLMPVGIAGCIMTLQYDPYGPMNARCWLPVAGNQV